MRTFSEQSVPGFSNIKNLFKLHRQNFSVMLQFNMIIVQNIKIACLVKQIRVGGFIVIREWRCLKQPGVNSHVVMADMCISGLYPSVEIVY